MPSKSRKKKLRFHESTQRALCRFVFLWFALMPMLGVASFSILKRTPWYQSEQKQLWQRRLSENLGVNVSFGSIEFPSPNQFRTTDLVCANPETGREILRVAQAKVDMDRSGWSVDLFDPVLNGNELQNSMKYVHDWFLCRPQKVASLLKLSLPELTIDDGQEKLRLQTVEVGLQPSESTSLLIVKFSLAGQKPTTPAFFRIDRNHIDEATKWWIDTHELQIPCHLLSERFPALKHLGNQARFAGKIEWWETKQNWTTQIAGTAFNVDLGKASMPLQNPLNGFGDLTIHTLIVDGDLQSLRGSMHSRLCSLETAWLDRAHESAKLYSDGKNIPWSTLGSKVEARHLGIQFGLTPTGLVFRDNPKRKDLTAIVASQVISNAMSAYSKPILPEQQPSRIADGRRP